MDLLQPIRTPWVHLDLLELFLDLPRACAVLPFALAVLPLVPSELPPFYCGRTVRSSCGTLLRFYLLCFGTSDFRSYRCGSAGTTAFVKTSFESFWTSLVPLDLLRIQRTSFDSLETSFASLRYYRCSVAVVLLRFNPPRLRTVDAFDGPILRVRSGGPNVSLLESHPIRIGRP